MSEQNGTPFVSEYTDPNDGNNGINKGRKFEATDYLCADDLNKIVDNELYLHSKISLYRHRLTFNCNSNGVAYYEFVTKSSQAVDNSNILSALALWSGGNIGACGFRNKDSVIYIVSDIYVGADGALTANGLKIDGSVPGNMDVSDYKESTGVTFTDTVTEV